MTQKTKQFEFNFILLGNIRQNNSFDDVIKMFVIVTLNRPFLVKFLYQKNGNSREFGEI